MKTFDLALKHLDGADLKHLQIYKGFFGEDIPEDIKAVAEELEKRHVWYMRDIRNTFSNDYWKNVVFATAVLHLAFKANGEVSFFDVAREIIESDADILGTEYARFANTAYPMSMVNKWDNYCDGLKSRMLALEGELRHDYFFTAYHYFVDNI